jgi:glutamate-1-semialdehyde 2,1-aminomutase
MTVNIDRSIALFEEAQRRLPGGVNSPVRSFRAVGGQPRFVARASGSRVWDVDGNEYIDYVLSWGPLILGHAHPQVVRAIQQAAANGTSYGAPSPLEIELARLVQSFMPGLEMLRFVNSGTEATMSALRLARAYTGRDKIVKFAGHYHGHADMLLAQAGSGVATLGLPDSAGVPRAAVADTLVVPFNDFAALERVFEKWRKQIAAVIVEPVAGNMGCVPPAAGFLRSLRDITNQDGALLIFDEVITGFRVHPGGAQALFGIAPDLTTLGKVIGGGLPVGAYGGRREVMQLVAPLGPMYQAGTLSGNPLAMAAGIATLKQLQDENVWIRLESSSARLVEGLAESARQMRVSIQPARVGSMFTLFFADQPVIDWTSAARCDRDRFARFFAAMLGQGVYLPPSQFEAAFLSTAHTDDDIDRTIATAAAKALATFKN